MIIQDLALFHLSMSAISFDNPDFADRFMSVKFQSIAIALTLVFGGFIALFISLCINTMDVRKKFSFYFNKNIEI